MNRHPPTISGVVSVDNADSAREQITPIVSAVLDSDGESMFARVFDDVCAIFDGRYPGYRASNTTYHDFGHTASVVLAAARLLHGCILDGASVSPANGLLTLVGAFFHDVGLIQTEDDRKGSGAKYTVGHEERSIRFLRRYLAGKGFGGEEIQNAANFIRCTNLSVPPGDVSFSSEQMRTCGNIVGTADLLSQMADRLYLEKLLLLFKEFEEARLPGFDSELDLLMKTKDFYEVVAKKRFKALGGVGGHMKTHFRTWENIDADFYADAIEKNIQYLQTVIDRCQDSFDCYLAHLRRGGIASKIRSGMKTKT